MAEQTTDNNRVEMFREHCRALQDLAQVTAGRYEVVHGLDDREIQAMQTPFLKRLVPIVTAFESARSNLEFERQVTNAVVNWQYRQHSLRLQVRNISFHERSGERPEGFELIIRTVLPSNRVLALTVMKQYDYEKGHIRTGSRSMSLPAYVRFFLPDGVTRTFDGAPNATYYCSLGSRELDTKFIVRSAPVSFGQVFAQQEEIRNCLRQTSQLYSLMVGHYDWRFGAGDNVVILDGTSTPDLEQLQYLLNLVYRTLDVLEDLKLID
jgi:hypothetical protein